MATEEPPAARTPISGQEASDAATAHYLGLLFLMGPFGWIGPLMYRNNAGRRSQFVRTSATAALNFHLSLLLYDFIVGVILVAVGVAVFMSGAYMWLLLVAGIWLAVSLSTTVWGITGGCMAATRAGRGEIYPYPGALRMVKS